jgi:IS5 family transposase
MLLEKYDPVNLFAQVPLKRDPILDRLDKLLEADALFQGVKEDLARRCPRTLTAGRHSTPVEVILRMVAVKHMYNWSYEETETFVGDSIGLRQFCRVYWNRVPDDTTLIRAANLIQPETLHELLDHVVELARQRKVTRGRKLRSDGTVVESPIHYPTDSSLLVDGVRVLSRTLKRAQGVVQAAASEGQRVGKEAFRSRLRSARDAARRISEVTRRRGNEVQEQCPQAYRKLVQVSQASVKQAQQVVKALQQAADAEAERLLSRLQQVIPLVEQVIAQTVRRVFQGEQVPAKDKIVSLFEPHTDIIRRDKEHKPTEFGHKVWMDEVDGRIISDYRVLDGNPGDQTQWRPSLEHHLQQFGKPPQQASADRGVYSAPNEEWAEKMGVQHVILPKPGHVSKERRRYERQRWFTRGRRYHNGIEGRISGLKRAHGLDRCLYHGPEGFERWVGWGIIAHDLLVIGAALAS